MASPPGGFALRVESGSQAGRMVPLGRHALVIGRDPEVDLVLDDDRVSRRHAALVADGSAGLLLRDLSSTNGTWLDDRRVEGAASVSAGTRIRIGTTWLAIVEHEVTPPAAAATSAVTSMDQSGVRRLQEELRHGNRRVMVLTVGVAVSLLLVIVLAATVLTGRRSPAADRSPADIAADSKPGTVQVRGQLDGRQVAAGSGWVLDADQGLIVTNHHVVSGASSYTVAVDGRDRAAWLVATAPCDDLALLRVDDRATMRALPLGAQADLRQGDQVVALGYPVNAASDNSLTITVGVVSVVRTTAEGGRLSNVVQTDAAINPGNSGGPLLGRNGQLVGVNTLTLESENGVLVQNQNYAIGVDRVREVTQVLRGGQSPAWTGLWVEEPSGDSRLERLARQAEALLVLGVAPGTPAAAAGLDGPMLLTQVDGRRLDGTLTGYCRALSGFRRGDRVAMSIVRATSAVDPQPLDRPRVAVVDLPLLG
jgi:S1-C subfamily serine protease